MGHASQRLPLGSFQVNLVLNNLCIMLFSTVSITFYSIRFNVIEWGSVEREMGLIAGGGDNGIISLWDPQRILRFTIILLVVLIVSFSY